tara:strand:+ start:226 stop:414 length:189 start_codon:yes stop_codon:yes gene_type:complete
MDFSLLLSDHQDLTIVARRLALALFDLLNYDSEPGPSSTSGHFWNLFLAGLVAFVENGQQGS